MIYLERELGIWVQILDEAKRRENFEFKPALLHLKIDLVLYPAHSGKVR